MTVDYIPFAAPAPTNPVMSQVNYAALAPNGVAPGLADPTAYNKATRQASMVAAMIATFIANVLTINVNDDGNLALLLTNFEAALASYIGGLVTAPIRIAAGGVTINATAADGTIAVHNTTTNPTVVNLPAAPPQGRIVSVKDDMGNSNTYNCTVKTTDGTTIDTLSGSAPGYVMAVDLGFAKFHFNGTQWDVVG